MKMGRCVMARILIVTAVGPRDPTRASLPFHIAVNGAVPAAQECAVAVIGDAIDLMKRDVAGSVRGVGVPPLADLLAGCAQKNIRFYV
jgi:predicted peroxiredoxin